MRTLSPTQVGQNWTNDMASENRLLFKWIIWSQLLLFVILGAFFLNKFVWHRYDYDSMTITRRVMHARFSRKTIGFTKNIFFYTAKNVYCICIRWIAIVLCQHSYFILFVCVCVCRFLPLCVNIPLHDYHFWLSHYLLS